jgi:hypothetical protein
VANREADQYVGNFSESFSKFSSEGRASLGYITVCTCARQLFKELGFQRLQTLAQTETDQKPSTITKSIEIHWHLH